ncbi:MAG: acyl-CoA dehydratase activase [bacterium]
MGILVGIDAGAVTTKIAILDQQLNLIGKSYLRNHGDPIATIAEILRSMGKIIGEEQVIAAGATGSARRLAAAIMGADVVKNEITSHAQAAVEFNPDVRTLIDIGGQDSKLIMINQGEVVDFATNTRCAAGTGAFLDHQASRMALSIEDFAEIAANAENTVRITGGCAVFAETDLIEKQQSGIPLGAIARGLCETLVMNYLSTVASGKDILEPVVFHGGVAFNKAVRKAFEEQLGFEIIVPENHEVMGAIGVAIIASKQKDRKSPSKFRAGSLEGMDLMSRIEECDKCYHMCRIVTVYDGEDLVGTWGDLCDRWKEK